jgi:hypothetical protein
MTALAQLDRVTEFPLLADSTPYVRTAFDPLPPFGPLHSCHSVLNKRTLKMVVNRAVGHRGLAPTTAGPIRVGLAGASVVVLAALFGAIQFVATYPGV